MVKPASMEGIKIAFLLALTGVVHGQCPTGWQPYGESCFFLHTHDKYDWVESAAFCGTHNAHLAYVDDAAENAFVKGMITKSLTGGHDANVWLGATDEILEGTWQWAGTEQVVTFFDWGPNEPNSVPLNIVEDCLVYWQDYHWKWADLDCHQKCFFVCERPMESLGVIG